MAEPIAIKEENENTRYYQIPQINFPNPVLKSNMGRYGLKIKVNGGVLEEELANNTNNSSKLSMYSPINFKSKLPATGVVPPMIPTAQPDSGFTNYLSMQSARINRDSLPTSK